MSITCFTKIKFVHLYKICFMWSKIEILCQKYNLKASELAKRLEVDPSVLSHLKTGRNKPKSDFIIKLLRAYPDINPDWLLLDSDQMYRDQAAATRADQSDDNLFSFDSAEQTSAPTFAATENNDATTNTPSVGTSQIANNIQQMARSGSRNVKRVIVLFDDHTFESYDMK